MFRFNGEQFKLTEECSTSNEDRRTRRNRTAFTEHQLRRLEQEFEMCKYPDISQRETLGKEIDLAESRIQVWFKNRRAKHRKRQRNRSPSCESLHHANGVKKPDDTTTIITWTPGASLKCVMPSSESPNIFVQYFQSFNTNPQLITSGSKK